MAKAPAIGIDLGTTYSCVAVYRHGKVEIIANDEGNRTTASYVAFTDEQRLVGDAAKSQAALNPENTIFDAKRLIGRRYDDPTVQEDVKLWPFKVINDSERVKIQVEYKGETRNFYPEQISAMILEKMKGTAESYLGQTVRDAVVTVPAYFNDHQRNSTKVAAQICDLNVLQILNEPTAAAIAYGFDKKFTERKNVLVFDLGGGTLDVSILSINNGSFEVKATAGNTHLGGEDLDNRMVSYFVEEIKRKYNKDLSKNKRALRRLRSACESAKRHLSSFNHANIEVDTLFDGTDFRSSITRARFEKLTIDLLRNILEPLRRALDDSGLDKSQIDDVVLVGGSTRIPMVQQLLQDFFNGKELNKSINPDEAVAYGAALQAAVLTGDNSDEIKDLVLSDVTPLSLGLECEHGLMGVVIKRNTPTPTRTTTRCTTMNNSQTEVIINVYEGERTFTKDNYLLGSFRLTGISRARECVPEIDVTFDLDLNGILNVTAVETSTGKSKSITITHDKGRLSQEEVNRLIVEAENYKAEDEKHKQRVTARDALEAYCLSMKRNAERKQNNVLSHSERKTLLENCNKVIFWLEQNPSACKEDIEDVHRKLKQICGSIKT